MNRRYRSTCFLAVLLACLIFCPHAHSEIDYMKEGNALRDIKKYREAIEEYKKELKIHPENSDAYESVAGCYISMGKHDSAVKILEAGLKYSPDDLRLHKNLVGQICVFVKDHPKCLKTAQKALSVYEQTNDRLSDFEIQAFVVSIYADLLQEYFKWDQIEKAREMAKKMMALDPKINWNVFLLPEQLAALNIDGKNAVSSTPSEPENPDPDYFYNKALDLFDQQNFTGAINMLQKEIRTNPKNVRGYGMLFSAYAALGNLKEAERWFHKAVELDPTNAVTYWNWGLHVSDRGCDEAKKYFAKAMELKPGDAAGATGAYRTLALCYERRGDINKAGEYYLKTLEITPTDESALSMIKSSPQLSEKITPERIQKLHALYLKREEERKKKVLEEAGKRKAKSAEYHSLGLEYFNKGEYEAAIEMWKKEIEINPKGPWPYFDIGLCYAKLEKYQESIPYHKKAIELGLPDVKGHHELSLTYDYLGDMEKAKEVVLDAMKKFPYNKKTLELVETYSNNKIIPSDRAKEFRAQYEKNKKEREQKIKEIEEQTKRARQEPIYIAYFKEILLSLLVLALISFVYFKPWYSYYLYAGNRHLKAQQYEQAAQYYEKLFAIRNGRNVPYDKLKRVYLKLGRKDEKAIYVYEKIYKQNPEDREVIAALAQVYAERQ